jgi:AraC-like DNA-binding protein
MSRNVELSVAYARLVLQSGVASPNDLLQGARVTGEALAEMEFINATDLAVLFRNYDRFASDRAWTARLGSQFNMAAHGPLGFAALSAPTLGEALDVMGNLSASRTTALNVHLVTTPTHYALHIRDVTGDPGFSVWMIEVVLKIVEVLIATIIGHPVSKNVVISFCHAAPADAARLIAAFDSEVVFNATHNSIAVPLAWRHLPSPLHDESVYRANVIKCRELIAAREQTGSTAFAVHSRLCNHFDAQMLYTGQSSPPPTLEQLADTMHLTSRTLIRKLQREQTTYKEVLEDLRKDYAGRLLRDARLNVADVAEILGYREAANFSRAFRRWHGTTPAAWRRR